MDSLGSAPDGARDAEGSAGTAGAGTDGIEGLAADAIAAATNGVDGGTVASLIEAGAGLGLDASTVSGGVCLVAARAALGAIGIGSAASPGVREAGIGRATEAMTAALPGLMPRNVDGEWFVGPSDGPYEFGPSSVGEATRHVTRRLAALAVDAFTSSRGTA